MHRYEVVKLSDRTLSATPVTSFPRKDQALAHAAKLAMRSRSGFISYDVWDRKKRDFVK